MMEIPTAAQVTEGMVPLTSLLREKNFWSREIPCWRITEPYFILL
jgi:hypothetical protein